MDALTLAPFFNEAPPSDSGCKEIVPLQMQVEWASPKAAVVIPLFRYRPQPSTDKLRLEHIVVSSAQLPFEVECSPYHAVESPSGVFLPLEGLLSALYARHRIGRSIFALLEELAGLVPLYGSVRHPIATPGLLVPQVESRGFILNTVVHGDGRLFVEIGWKPRSQEYVFHVGLCAFNDADVEYGHPGVWIRPGVIGVAQLLSRELRQLISGEPRRLLTPAGLKLLQNHLLINSSTAAPD